MSPPGMRTSLTTINTFFYEDVRLIPSERIYSPPYSNKKSLQQPDESATDSCLTKSALTALSYNANTIFVSNLYSKDYNNEPKKLQVFLAIILLEATKVKRLATQTLTCMCQG